MNKLKYYLSALSFILLCACSSASVDTANGIYVAQNTYLASSNVALSYIKMPGADPAVVAIIAKSNEYAHSAIAAAVAALQQCAYDEISHKFDTVCSNSSAVTGAFATAKQAVEQFSSDLAANGVK